MADQVQDQEFLEYIVKAIVGRPEDVSVERTVDERGVLLTLKINPEDMGYIIGRRGQTAQAVRTLLKIVGAKNNARVNLKIYEPEGSHRRRSFEEGSPAQSQAQAPAGAPLGDVDTSAVDDLDI